ncbi:hypothetical protein DFH08DRAFT_411872 [Mycena albidolilacea]|uniref:Uncharacterized protein n=1 Tax=Mycena albidolilacea TaxID=1033008 RepID=A0AAD7AIA2_9AGAR|nr:hypothetical protein DFH08DRAFT_411872 [Mycena albidolilacea]
MPPPCAPPAPQCGPPAMSPPAHSAPCACLPAPPHPRHHRCLPPHPTSIDPSAFTPSRSRSSSVTVTAPGRPTARQPPPASTPALALWMCPVSAYGRTPPPRLSGETFDALAGAPSGFVTMTVPAPLYPDSANTVGSAFGAMCPTSGAISICADGA